MIASRAAVAALVMWAVPALAQEQGSDQTLAQTLFDEGVKLMEQGKFDEACPKLAESQRLDPGGGTLLNLGYCRQNEGKLASAWAAYDEALSQAIKDNRKDRENSARVHVDELQGKLAKLAIDLSDAAAHTSQIEIRLDGTPVRQAAWGVLAPIDCGTHAVVVTAPGKREFHTSVSVDNDGTVQRVSIPALEDAPVVVPLDHGDNRLAEHPFGFRGQGTFGVGLLTVGAVVLAGGIATGIGAVVLHDNSGCDGSGNCATQKGVDLDNQANALAWGGGFAIPSARSPRLWGRSSRSPRRSHAPTSRPRRRLTAPGYRS